MTGELKAIPRQPNVAKPIGEGWGLVETYDGKTYRNATVFYKNKAHCYEIGTLQDARERFVEITKMQVSWPKPVVEGLKPAEEKELRPPDMSPLPPCPECGRDDCQGCVM